MVKTFNLYEELKKKVKSKYIVDIILNYACIKKLHAQITYTEATESRKEKILNKVNTINNISEEIFNYIMSSQVIKENQNINISTEFFIKYGGGIELKNKIKSLEDMIKNYNNYILNNCILGYRYINRGDELNEDIGEHSKNYLNTKEYNIIDNHMFIIGIKNYNGLMKNIITKKKYTKKYSELMTCI